jgi:hypothetical protein
MTYDDIYKLAADYNHNLLATDVIFTRSAEVTHADDSYFRWRHSSIMTKENWVIVFTEHFGFHLFERSDLQTFRHYTLGAPFVTEEKIEEMP